MLKVNRLKLGEHDELLEIEPSRLCDHRGTFSETYNARAFSEIGVDTHFCQDNQSTSTLKGTVRGLHYQIAPFAQAKLVRVLRGAIIDVAVDIRHGSPTYGGHVSTILSAENGRQLFVPIGFAHGFCTLEPDTAVAYKVSAFYSKAHEFGLLWNDPALAIDWGVEAHDAVLSDKDWLYPPLAELPAHFHHDLAAQ